MESSPVESCSLEHAHETISIVRMDVNNNSNGYHKASESWKGTDVLDCDGSAMKTESDISSQRFTKLHSFKVNEGATQNHVVETKAVESNGHLLQVPQGSLTPVEREEWNQRRRQSGNYCSQTIETKTPRDSRKKATLMSVFHRKFKSTTSGPSSIFKIDPVVNRPQVLAPGALQSVGMQRMKQKTDHALQWINPHVSTKPTSTSATKTVPSTLFNRSLSAEQSSSAVTTAPDSRQTDRSHSKDFAFGVSGNKTSTRSAQIPFDRRRASIDVPTIRQPSGRRASESISTRGLGAGTPMGDLLMSRKDGKWKREKYGQSTKSVFGPSDFLELVRSKAYSDSRQTDAGRTSVTSQEHRDSDVRSQTPVSSTAMSHGDSGTDDKSMKPNIFRKRTNQTFMKELPVTIPEHKEMNFCSSIVSLPSPSQAAGGGGNVDLTFNEDGRLGRVDRRFSEPPLPSSEELSNLQSCYLKARIGLVGRRSSSELEEFNGSSITSGSPKRTSDLAISPEILGIDPPLLSRHRLIVWRDHQSTQILKLPVSVDYYDTLQKVIDDDENQIYAELMKIHSCCELMPNSSTVILLDVHLKVISAFYAMTLNGVKAAALWDPTVEQFVGMLTVTDFIRMLQLYRSSEDDLEGIKDEKILSWKEKLGVRRNLVYADSNESLYEAICRLIASNIHRLPVFDTVNNNVLYTLSFERILQFICLFINNLPTPSFMSKNIWDLRVGTFDSIASIGVDRPLSEAFEKLIDRCVSSLPVIDGQNKVVNVFSKADVMLLAADGSYKNLDATIGDILSADKESCEGVYLCKRTDSLSQVIEWIVRTNVQRLIVVDDDQKLQGIVSLSDIVRFLVLRPPKANVPNEDGLDKMNYHQTNEVTAF